MTRILASFAALVLAAASLVAQGSAPSPAATAGKDAKLDSLISQMNSARGDAKLDAAVAVINELVAQRNALLAAGGPGCAKGAMSSHDGHNGHDCAMMAKTAGGKDCCPAMSKGSKAGCCAAASKGAKKDCCADMKAGAGKTACCGSAAAGDLKPSRDEMDCCAKHSGAAATSASR